MGNDLLSPTGIITLIIAGMLDVAGWVCLILVAAFGIGALLGQIVNIAGYIVLGVLLFLKTGKIPTKKAEPGQDKGGGVAGGIVKKFLKKQWKKLVVETCPILGDLYPGFTMMVYSELKDSS